MKDRKPVIEELLSIGTKLDGDYLCSIEYKGQEIPIFKEENQSVPMLEPFIESKAGCGGMGEHDLLILDYDGSNNRYFHYGGKKNDFDYLEYMVKDFDEPYMVLGCKGEKKKNRHFRIFGPNGLLWENTDERWAYFSSYKNDSCLYFQNSVQGNELVGRNIIDGKVEKRILLGSLSPLNWQGSRIVLDQTVFYMKDGLLQKIQDGSVVKQTKTENGHLRPLHDGLFWTGCGPDSGAWVCNKDLYRMDCYPQGKYRFRSIDNHILCQPGSENEPTLLYRGHDLLAKFWKSFHLINPDPLVLVDPNNHVIKITDNGIKTIARVPTTKQSRLQYGQRPFKPNKFALCSAVRNGYDPESYHLKGRMRYYRMEDLNLDD